MLVASGAQKERRRVYGSARNHNNVPGVGLRASVSLHENLCDFSPCATGLQALYVCICQECDIGVLQRRIYAHHLGIRLCQDQARKAITGVAADTFACVPILFIKLDAQGHMKRLEAKAREIISQPLHSGLVAHRRVRVWPAGRWFGGVHATLAMDVIEMLRLQVVRLKVLVRDWPRGRDPAMMTDLAKIFLTQPEKSRTIKLGISSYVVVC